MDISTTLHAKAQRLVDEGRVTHVKGLMYKVQGDTDTYSVHLSYPQEATGSCNCLRIRNLSPRTPTGSALCSHILAASISYLADPPPVPVAVGDPFEGLN